MQTYRILHLSDLHLARRANVVNFFEGIVSGYRADVGLLALLHLTSYSSVQAERIARFAYHHARGIDLILITGDIATSGAPHDMQVAHRFVAAPPGGRPGSGPWCSLQGTRWLPTLRGSRRDVVLLPGNHDRFMWLALPGGRTFDNTFAKYWRVGQGVQLQLVNRDSTDRLAIIAADCSLRSWQDANPPALPYYACQGKAYLDSIVAELSRQTNAVRAKHGPVAVVWALHFPPAPPTPAPFHGLIGEGQLLTEAQRCGVAYVFCGHLHQRDSYTPSGFEGLTVRQAGTPCQAGGLGNELLVENIHVDGGCIRRCHRDIYRWNRDEFVFVGQE